MHIVRVFDIRGNRMGEGLMNKKNDILESWIMVEHLSEGDINLKGTPIGRSSSGGKVRLGRQ